MIYEYGVRCKIYTASRLRTHPTLLYFTCCLNLIFFSFPLLLFRSFLLLSFFLFFLPLSFLSFFLFILTCSSSLPTLGNVHNFTFNLFPLFSLLTWPINFLCVHTFFSSHLTLSSNLILTPSHTFFSSFRPIHHYHSSLTSNLLIHPSHPSFSSILLIKPFS